MNEAKLICVCGHEWDEGEEKYSFAEGGYCCDGCHDEWSSECSAASYEKPQDEDEDTTSNFE